MERITSPANPRIKAIRKLRDRKEREASGLFLIEGLHIVGEAVQQGAQIETLLVSSDLLTSEFGWEMAHSLAAQGAPILDLSAEVFRGLSVKEGPQGIAALVRQRWSSLADIDRGAGKDWVALDAAQDPGNVGTILRANDAVGGAGVILLDHSTDPYDSGAIRASMGALFNQQVVRASFEEFAEWKSASPVALVGTSGAAAQDYHQIRYPQPLVLLMGSERFGLQERHLNLCDAVVSIPMMGRSDSLNLAVATGVVLYEIFNQRREQSGYNKVTG